MKMSEKTRLLGLLVEVVSDWCDQESGLLEASKSKLTPFQKAQRNRRQTVAAHTPRPAKQSTFYKHAVRAIFQNLRKSGEGFKGAAAGGQRIAQHMLKKYGYASGQESGNFRLTSKGHSRNRKHTNEPSSVKKKKSAAYDYIMGIRRRQQKQQKNVRNKSASAG